jgi:hypothetical protein
MSVPWSPQPGLLGGLSPLVGTWVAEGETATGDYRCERRFDEVLHRRYVQLVVTWILPGRSHEELALFGIDAEGVLRMWSFTSDGKQSTGVAARADDLPQPNVAFEADMPSGRARFAYWPEDEGVRFVVEARTDSGWTRFLEHRYVRID